MVTFYLLYLVFLRKRDLSLQSHKVIKNDKVTFTDKLETYVGCKTLIIKVIERNWQFSRKAYVRVLAP